MEASKQASAFLLLFYLANSDSHVALLVRIFGWNDTV